MKNLLSYLLVGVLGIFGLSACGGDVSNSAANTSRAAINKAVNVANSVANAVSDATAASPESFMKDAAQNSMAEIEMGKLAEQKSQNPEIKKFGQMLVTDHTAAGNELKALAAKKNITLPADTGSHKSMIESLGKESGAGFDKAYINAMVSHHEDDLKAFQKQAENSADPDVKAFAAKIVPVLRKHFDAVKALEAK